MKKDFINFKIPHKKSSFLTIYLQLERPNHNKYLIIHSFRGESHIIYYDCTLTQAKKIVKSFGAKEI